ncbi:MAG: hypothetical protein V4492_03655 [Chlamydiota bacterium]
MKELPPLAGWPDQVHLVHDKTSLKGKRRKSLPHLGKKSIIKKK